jgi:hypothetical protein
MHCTQTSSLFSSVKEKFKLNHQSSTCTFILEMIKEQSMIIHCLSPDSIWKILLLQFTNHTYHADILYFHPHHTLALSMELSLGCHIILMPLSNRNNNLQTFPKHILFCQKCCFMVVCFSFGGDIEIIHCLKHLYVLNAHMSSNGLQFLCVSCLIFYVVGYPMSHIPIINGSWIVLKQFMEHASYICTDLPNCVMGCFELGSHKNGT